LSDKLRFLFLDTGALYRAVAVHLLRCGISPDTQTVPPTVLDSLDLRVDMGIGAMRVYLNNEEIGPLIRAEEISAAASKFSALKEVREALLVIQRTTADQHNTVAEGRDMGTVVFPYADVKFFLTADLTERARRRYGELSNKGLSVEVFKVEEDMRERDERDESRVYAPLVKADDAVCIDTTRLAAEQVLQRLLEHIARMRFSALNGIRST
ncbi:MAG: CMP/dCMP kinase, partial [Thermodesulfobacteriota bacterium]|nr:CMP/dCMP kinase [Thermodesulfobacteriota bacterium]